MRADARLSSKKLDATTSHRHYAYGDGALTRRGFMDARRRLFESIAATLDSQLLLRHWAAFLVFSRAPMLELSGPIS
jgi:hypothetical protein